MYASGIAMTTVEDGLTDTEIIMWKVPFWSFHKKLVDSAKKIMFEFQFMHNIMEPPVDNSFVVKLLLEQN